MYNLWHTCICTKVIPDPPVATPELTLPVTFLLGSPFETPQQTYEWFPPEGDVIGGIKGYNLNSTDSCGNCTRGLVSNTTYNATCIGWMGENCTFEVRTVTADCGFMSEPIMARIVFDGKP